MSVEATLPSVQEILHKLSGKVYKKRKREAVVNNPLVRYVTAMLEPHVVNKTACSLPFEIISEYENTIIYNVKGNAPIEKLIVEFQPGTKRSQTISATWKKDFLHWQQQIKIRIQLLEEDLKEIGEMKINDEWVASYHETKSQKYKSSCTQTLQYLKDDIDHMEYSHKMYNKIRKQEKKRKMMKSKIFGTRTGVESPRSPRSPLIIGSPLSPKVRRKSQKQQEQKQSQKQEVPPRRQKPRRQKQNLRSIFKSFTNSKKSTTNTTNSKKPIEPKKKNSRNELRY